LHENEDLEHKGVVNQLLGLVLLLVSFVWSTDLGKDRIFWAFLVLSLVILGFSPFEALEGFELGWLKLISEILIFLYSLSLVFPIFEGDFIIIEDFIVEWVVHIAYFTILTPLTAFGPVNLT